MREPSKRLDDGAAHVGIARGQATADRGDRVRGDARQRRNRVVRAGPDRRRPPRARRSPAAPPASRGCRCGSGRQSPRARRPGSPSAAAVQRSNATAGGRPQRASASAAAARRAASGPDSARRSGSRADVGIDAAERPHRGVRHHRVRPNPSTPPARRPRPRRRAPRSRRPRRCARVEAGRRCASRSRSGSAVASACRPRLAALK